MKHVSLDDKYTATSGRIYLNGVQALVRLMLVQRQRDLAQGLHTAGFVSGYRGSPLGGLDEALWAAERHLKEHHVKFLPGLNEELAATAVWGTQQVHLTGGTEYDGVFALWYGKAPGVDRCGDVFKHMAHAGTSRHGGVLLVAGDDHGAYSSTLPNQSDHLFAASMIPMLYPQGVEDYLTLGLLGFAMSRHSGLPVGFKALADTVESSGSIDLAAVRRMAAPGQPVLLQRRESLGALVAQRTEFLTAYQSVRYGSEYTRFVERVRAIESSTVGGDQLARAVAVNLFRLMAYKDEYEVARLFTDGAFARQLAEQFEGKGKITFHMAPPILGKRDAAGHPVKQAFGPWMRPVLRVLASLRWVRGSVLDPFARSAERRAERELIVRYRTIIGDLLQRLGELDPATVVAVARVPEQIRGYGHVKASSMTAADAQWTQLLSGFE